MSPCQRDCPWHVKGLVHPPDQREDKTVASLRPYRQHWQTDAPQSFVPTPEPQPVRTVDDVRAIRKRIEATDARDIRELSREWQKIRDVLDGKAKEAERTP